MADIIGSSYIEIDIPLASKVRDRLKEFSKIRDKSCFYCAQEILDGFGLLTNLDANTNPIRLMNYVACPNCFEDFNEVCRTHMKKHLKPSTGIGMGFHGMADPILSHNFLGYWHENQPSEEGSD